MLNKTYLNSNNICWVIYMLLLKKLTLYNSCTEEIYKKVLVLYVLYIFCFESPIYLQNFFDVINREELKHGLWILHPSLRECVFFFFFFSKTQCSVWLLLPISSSTKMPLTLKNPLTLPPLTLLLFLTA